MKVAIVHDFLREYGGAERVVEALHETFPDAPLFVAFCDEEAMGIHWQRFAGWKIHQSWISKIPLHRKLFSPLRVLAPAAFRSFDFSGYDVVISSSNAYFAKAVRVPKETVHLCYCHTPPRALYGYSTMTDWKKNPVIKVAGTLINHVCRIMDARSAKGVDVFIANSQEVERRIQKFYRRDAVIIHPPVCIPKKFPQAERSYFLYVNRLAFAKHPELAVQAATALNLPLKVVGTGKMLPELQQMAGPTVEFLGGVSDEQLYKLYEGAEALLYPVEDEDFGIVPVEAMGYGVPVIAHRSGGPTETIVDKKTGLFFDELTLEGMIEALREYNSISFDRTQIHKHALQYDSSIFSSKIDQLVKKHLKTKAR
jgi:glycosyltransferase involved in cell wall biosynthesis